MLGLRRRVARCFTARRLPRLLVLTAVLGGCSSTSWLSAPPGSGPVSIGDRISGFITGQSGTSANAQATPLQPEDFDCPRMDIRPGASTLIVSVPGGEENALGLRYQGTFVRAARECSAHPPNFTLKIGVQGRVILGPAGVAGELTIPLRYALVQEKLAETKPIWSKLYSVPVQIPPREPSVIFTHVEPGITLPIPRAGDLEDYVIYIGFDPAGQELQKRPPPKPRARRAG